MKLEKTGSVVEPRTKEEEDRLRAQGWKEAETDENGQSNSYFPSDNADDAPRKKYKAPQVNP